MLRNQQSLATIPLSLVSNSVNIPRTVIFNPHRDRLRPRREKEILGRIFLSAFIWNLGADGGSARRGGEGEEAEEPKNGRREKECRDNDRGEREEAKPPLFTG